MFFAERKKRIFFIGSRKEFIEVIDFESKYCLEFFSISELKKGDLPSRPDMLLFSFEKSTEGFLLTFPENSFYYSIPIICLLPRGVPHLSLLKSGVIDCLEKPVTPSYLEAKIDSIFTLINRYILTYHQDFDGL